jgi:hypothetical protein
MTLAWAKRNPTLTLSMEEIASAPVGRKSSRFEWGEDEDTKDWQPKGYGIDTRTKQKVARDAVRSSIR